MKKQEFQDFYLDHKITQNLYKRKQKINTTTKNLSKILCYAILIFYAMISLYPFFWSTFASFKDPHLLTITGLNPFPHSFSAWDKNTNVDGWTLQNYTSLFGENGQFTDYASIWVKNSVIYSVASGLINATLNLLGGYALARIAMKGKNMIVMYFLVSILVPSQATFIPTYFMYTKTGIINPDITPNAFLFAIIFSGMANIILTFMARQFFLTQTAEMEEAAQADGYSKLWIFLRVTIRKMLPLFATQFVLVFMGAWNNFLTFQLFTGGDPDKMTITAGMFTIATSAVDREIGYGQTLAISNVSFVPMLLVYSISLRIQLKGIKGGNK